jgi:hypothetical protein
MREQLPRRTTMEPAKYPRVGLLRYFIQTPQNHGLTANAAADGTIGPFSYLLRFHSAEFIPLIDFPTVDDARGVLDPILQAWHVAAVLIVGPAGFTFKFTAGFVDNSESEARSRLDSPANWPPMPPKLEVQYDGYAAPIQWLVVDDCVRDLSEHYRAAQQSPRAQLLHGYAMVTRVKAAYSTEQNAAARLQISVECLRRLKRLATERGVGAEARKFTDNAPRDALTPQESVWIGTMMRVLVYRAGLVAGNHKPEPYLSVDQITPTIW